jgi:hypothetical protein
MIALKKGHQKIRCKWKKKQEKEEEKKKKKKRGERWLMHNNHVDLPCFAIVDWNTLINRTSLRSEKLEKKGAWEQQSINEYNQHGAWCDDYSQKGQSR